ncbi:flagellar biosynthesis protein, FliO [Ruminiclostridium hungatei]|uniref:Flagellar biosynthesis protein, FliO n=1 Tax=Ruminiclostridium hungatei TaxID=48256 RepID=A0A1V4SL10_RUMHU|nr:flagellar biosynthetic protein FliO [Ruminiclostridium hungatei]OPX44578.1 flagellar biosynthesis protein, FliO [Ruminiclostridium hungatei]
MEGIFKYFTVLLAFVVVMAILLLTTKYLTYKSKKMMKGNHMQIVESLSLGVNSRLHLVKVDREFLILSATNKSVEFLARVNISDYEEEEIKNPISEVMDFKVILKKYISGFNFGNSSAAGNSKTEETAAGPKPEEAALTDNHKFKNNLERLKNITNSMNDRRGQNEEENKN